MHLYAVSLVDYIWQIEDTSELCFFNVLIYLKD